MTRTTHLLGGAVLTEGALLVQGSLSSFPAHLGMSAVPVVGAILIGSTFPDIDLRVGIPHRTITHLPWVYLLVVGLGWWFKTPLVSLFSLSCLLHLALDSFTKMGVPVLNPFGKTYGLRIVHTRGLGEYLFIFAFFAMLAGLLLVHP